MNKIRRAWINRMLSNVLGVFFFSKSAEFLHVAPDSLEKHCPAFFFRQIIRFIVRIANKRNLTCSRHCLHVGT